MDFTELREMYKEFIYDSYYLHEDDNNLIITYNFLIPGLMNFHPKLKIPKKDIVNPNIDFEFRDNLIFHVGLIEMISYYKCCCPPKITIKAGSLDNNQIKFLKKILYYGLGEFFYKNNINTTEDDLVEIVTTGKKLKKVDSKYQGNGNLIPIGGGKDSCVTLEILKNLDSYPVVQNPKQVQLDCIKASKISEDKIITFERTIEKDKFQQLSKLGFLNGHTPFSALLAFELYLIAYLTNKKYIILSNENSANEGTIIGTKTNHQYSKTFEFENDFNNYVDNYLKTDIHYFSFLRPLSEYQIGMLFSKYQPYHKVFKSCNVGSKKEPWTWCCNCPKCLFVYIILSPYLYKDKLLDIFGEDMFDNKLLLPTLKELLGETGIKPFECVGEVSEVKYALSLLLSSHHLEKLPVLLEYFKNNYPLDLSLSLEKQYNNKNIVPEDFQKILRKELDKYV